MPEVALLPTDTSELSPIETKQLRKERLLNEAGVTKIKLYQTLEKGLGAMRIVVDRYGDEILRTPDDAVRHKYMETGLKLYGDLVEDKVGLNVLNLDARMSEMILKETRRAIAMQSADGLERASADGGASAEGTGRPSVNLP